MSFERAVPGAPTRAGGLGLALAFLVWPPAMGRAAEPAGSQQAPKQQPAPKPAESPAAAPGTTLPEYKVGSGDVLHLFVWKESDLTHNVTVRIDGRITVPLLGDLIAVGKTSADLGREITTALSRFVENPLVTVVVAQATSARFFAIGEVRNPGPHPLAGGMTLVQALALSGGFAQFAKKDEILVIRESRSFKVNFDRIQDGSELAHNLLLQPGDTIVVP